MRERRRRRRRKNCNIFQKTSSFIHPTVQMEREGKKTHNNKKEVNRTRERDFVGIQHCYLGKKSVHNKNQ
jgi:hypothetical protein